MLETLPGVARRALKTTGRRDVEGMLVTNHVLSGAVIGAASRRRPASAFALGVLSHFALDATPHWGKWNGRPNFMQVAVPDGLVGLAVMGTVTVLAPRDARVAVLAGMAGAALPDLDKPSILFFGRSPFPRVVDRLHMRIQHEAPHRLKYELAAAAIFLAAAVGLLHGQRKGFAFSGPPGRCRGTRSPR
ncbi:MAG: hypothetical protein ACRDOI_30510 [Trebonia sp.]